MFLLDTPKGELSSCMERLGSLCEQGVEHPTADTSTTLNVLTLVMMVILLLILSELVVQLV